MTIFLNVPALGDPRERYSRLAMWVQECIAFGLIDEAILVIETCEAARGRTTFYWLNLKTARSRYGAVRYPGQAA